MNNAAQPNQKLKYLVALLDQFKCSNKEPVLILICSIIDLSEYWAVYSYSKHQKSTTFTELFLQEGGLKQKPVRTTCLKKMLITLHNMHSVVSQSTSGKNISKIMNDLKI